MIHTRDSSVFLIYSKLHVIYFLRNIQLRASNYQTYFFKLLAVYSKMYETCFTEIEFYKR